MAKLKRVLDYVPVFLRGRKVDGEEHISFFHRCCRCGLRHSVVIKRKEGQLGCNITFVRLKDIKEKKNED
jgi:hypothetical protein